MVVVPAVVVAVVVPAIVVVGNDVDTECNCCHVTVIVCHRNALWKKVVAASFGRHVVLPKAVDSDSFGQRMRSSISLVETRNSNTERTFLVETVKGKFN